MTFRSSGRTCVTHGIILGKTVSCMTKSLDEGIIYNLINHIHRIKYET